MESQMMLRFALPSLSWTLKGISRRCLFLLLVFTAVSRTAWAEAADESSQPAKSRMTPELLWKLNRLSEAALSPDGQWAAFTVRRFQLEENSGLSDLYLVHTATLEKKQIISSWPNVSAIQWRGSASEPRLYFSAVSPNDKPAGPQVYRWSFSSEGPTKISNIAGGVNNLKVAPTEQHIAFTASVKMDSTVNELYPDLPKADARIIDSLMYRHWDSWHDFQYDHLHVAPLSSDQGVGEVKDLMAGLRADCPVPPFGGASQFDWSPDGRELAYTTKIDDKMAESTNSDIFLIDVDGTQAPRNITAGQMGYDNDPKYSPDGKYIAYSSMARPSYEADRNRIMLFDRQSQKSVDLSQELQQNADHGRWLPDASGLVFDSDHRGCVHNFQIKLSDKKAQQLSGGRANYALQDIAPGGQTALVARNDMIVPADLYLLNLKDGTEKQLTELNSETLAELELPTVQERWVDSTDGKRIHCWVIYPPGFDPNSDKKYPMLTFCQGGPQSQVSQFFSYRWNFHLMAAQDYIVLAPNRRGLPGFGLAWNEDISGDWGGQPMRDLLSATDSMLEEKYIDRKKVGAVGASFGGYTVYWMMGNAGDRFAAMISHCGVFNLESMYGTTEELFFVNWDLGGPYWKSPELRDKYATFSPHRFVKNWKTPLLVIHGEKDFRVPIGQGMEAFTTAQVQGVPSRFLYFPDEGHWVMKPQNSVLWYRVFFEWLDTHLKQSN
ncbi:MAG: S9 family peptidase [Planctomycetaceae bacterium]|nr:S9 family peptidase [Planctomycetaceae bacterium]